MNDSEESVYKYLTGLGLGTVVFEPDGRGTTPDFLVDGRIAVEVRRLNQNEKTARGHRGLEEVSRPLNAVVQKALAAMGPPLDGVSWFVHYSFRRPLSLPPGRQLAKSLLSALREIRDQPHLKGREVRVASKIRLRFTRANKVQQNLFVLGVSRDGDSGGFVVSEMARNLRVCIAQKTLKIAKAKSRYSEWWLAFEDRIGHVALEEKDRDQLRGLIPVEEPWSRIILVNQLEPSSAFDLCSASLAPSASAFMEPFLATPRNTWHA